MATARRRLYKICVVGETGTGKTSILNRYIDNKYQEERPTIGAHFLPKIILHADYKIQLQIWDTAGDTQYQSLGASFCRGSDALLIPFDITNRASFENIPAQRKKILDILKNDSIPVYFVGTKLDLVQENAALRQVTKEEEQALATQLNMIFLGEVSAKKNIGIEDDDIAKKAGIFTQIANDLLQQELRYENDNLDARLTNAYNAKQSFWRKKWQEKRGPFVAGLVAAALVITAVILAIFFWEFIVALAVLALIKLAVTVIMAIMISSITAGMIADIATPLTKEDSPPPVLTTLKTTARLHKQGLEISEDTQDNSSQEIIVTLDQSEPVNIPSDSLILAKGPQFG